MSINILIHMILSKLTSSFLKFGTQNPAMKIRWYAAFFMGISPHSQVLCAVKTIPKTKNYREKYGCEII